MMEVNNLWQSCAYSSIWWWPCHSHLPGATVEGISSVLCYSQLSGLLVKRELCMFCMQLVNIDSGRAELHLIGREKWQQWWGPNVCPSLTRPGLFWPTCWKTCLPLYCCLSRGIASNCGARGTDAGEWVRAKWQIHSHWPLTQCGFSTALAATAMVQTLQWATVLVFPLNWHMGLLPYSPTSGNATGFIST